jgi:hypothetical protein
MDADLVEPVKSAGKLLLAQDPALKRAPQFTTNWVDLSMERSSRATL